MTTSFQTVRFFSDTAAAVAYRREHGCGGWIFSSDAGAVLFPHDMTPTAVFTHQATRSLSGELV